MEKSASNLNESFDMAHIGLPIGPQCFFPKLDVLNYILAGIESAPAQIIQQVVLKLRYAHFQWTYKTPPMPEEHYCRINLDIVMDLISTLSKTMIDNLNTNNPTCKIATVSVAGAHQVTPKLSTVIAGKNTSPEPVLFLNFSDAFTVLATSEAKPVCSSHSLAQAQGVQMAGDGALNRAANGEAVEDIVVPFVTAAGNGIQFGAVYLMQPNFPCPVLLSSTLNLLIREDIIALAKWIYAIARYCASVAIRLSGLVEADVPSIEHVAIEEDDIEPNNIPIKSNLSTQNLKADGTGARKNSSGASATIDNSQQRLRNNIAGPRKILTPTIDAKCVLKPISASSIYTANASLHRLMNVFYLLQMSPTAARFVHFPLGFLGYPDEAQTEFKTFVDGRLLQLDQWKQDCSQHYSTRTYFTGYPLLVYEQLTKVNGWYSFDSPEVPVRVQEIALELLDEATKCFEDISIIHLDLRAPNLYVRLKNRVNSSNSFTTDEISKDTIELRIIDWDDSFHTDDLIPTNLYNNMQRLEQYPTAVPHATSAYHQSCVEYLRAAVVKRKDAKNRKRKKDSSPQGDEIGSPLQADGEGQAKKKVKKKKKKKKKRKNKMSKTAQCDD